MLRAGQAIELPFSLYSTFVIEARHGFNKVSLILYYQISPSFLQLCYGVYFKGLSCLLQVVLLKLIFL